MREDVPLHRGEKACRCVWTLGGRCGFDIIIARIIGEGKSILRRKGKYQFSRAQSRMGRGGEGCEGEERFLGPREALTPMRGEWGEVSKLRRITVGP